MKERPIRRRIFSVICFVFLVLAVAMPVDLGLQFLGTPQERWTNIALSMALVALVCSIAIGLIANRRAVLLALLPVLVVSVFIRLFYAALVHFSGQGFGHEVFVHLDPESFRILWYEYDHLVYRATGVCLLVAFAFWLMVRKQPPAAHRPVPMLGVAVVAALLLAFGRSQLPEWQLWRAWADWQRPSRVATPEQTSGRAASREPRPQMLPPEAARWNQTGLVDTDLPVKDQIRAVAGGRPKNLILLYVEALTSSIIEHPDYPELMPNFQRLIREHGWIDEFHTSSFVTIEGVANTQCGLLFPFRGHGSGFAGRTILAQSLPCLGDVLSEAGYHQTYILGGGPLSFTGKGSFLAAHGYDDLKGWEYWESHGHERAPGHWGMGDVDTLEQVRLVVAERQRQDRPFNVTSLTVGSHIPGYTYEGCEPYRDGSARYLDALHCTDQIVADWIERVETEGLLKDTVLVIVGDHPVFANPKMHELFGDAIHDTRLPLIIVGDDLKAPEHNRGAGFDLAPTLLDLLEIRHNAEFAMGRSLAAPHGRPDYLVTRRHDVHRGAPVHNSPGNCQWSNDKARQDGTPTLPLSPCDKRELIDILRELSQVYSHQPAPMDCTAEEPALLRVPAGRIGPVAIRINGRNWSNRFTWRGRMAHPTEPGLFALALDHTGRPTASAFLPAETVLKLPAEQLPEDVETAQSILIAWRPPGQESVDLSSVISSLPQEQSMGAAWLVKPGEAQPVASQSTTDGRPATLLIEGTDCKSVTRESSGT